MADVTVKRLDELESYEGTGRFIYAGKGLGVKSWGMNAGQFPAGWSDYPDHDHAKDGQEEVYVVLEGSATLHAGGETWEMGPGSMARVGPGEKRRFVPGDAGVTMVMLGGIPGKAWEPRT